MIVSHKYKFIFIKTPKTAGTSIEGYLSQFLDKDDVIAPMELSYGQNYRGFFNPIPGILLCLKEFKLKNRTAMGRYQDVFNLAKPAKIMFDFFHRNKFHEHMPAVFVKTRVPQEVWNDYYKLCVERNPWDKVVSHYYHVKNSNPHLSFDEYMDRELYTKKVINYPLYTDMKQENIIVDKIVYYENLNSELKDALNYLGIPFDGDLGVYAKSQFREDKRPYQDLFRGAGGYIDIIRDVFQKEIELHGYKFN